MSRSKRTAENYPPGVTGTEPQITGEDVGSPNGTGTDAPGEPSLVPVVQNVEGNGERKKKVEETKAQRFRRLAMARYPKAVKAIVALVALANKSQYESTEAQRAFMLAKLDEAVLKVKSAFSDTGAKTLAAEPLPD